MKIKYTNNLRLNKLKDTHMQICCLCLLPESRTDHHRQCKLEMMELYWAHNFGGWEDHELHFMMASLLVFDWVCSRRSWDSSDKYKS